MTEAVTHTIALDDMTTEQLVQLSQGLGHQIEDLRAKRLHIRQKIDARLAADRNRSIQAEIDRLQGQLNGHAPGKVMSVKAGAKRAK